MEIKEVDTEEIEVLREEDRVAGIWVETCSRHITEVEDLKDLMEEVDQTESDLMSN